MTIVLCVLLFYLLNGLGVLKDSDGSPIYKGHVLCLNSRHSDKSGESTTCSRAEVTVRDAYLALSPISARYETMAVLLDIDRGTLGNIRMDCPGDNDCKYRRTIEAWYKGRPEASWDELVFVLQQMGEQGLANYVKYEHLCFERDSVSSSNYDAFDEDLNDCDGPESFMIHLESEFQEMIVYFDEHLRHHPPDLDRFKQCITRLPVSLNEMYKPLFTTDLIRDIIKADSVSEIFAFFNVHVWNFLEYEIFQFIVARFGNKRLKNDFRKYLIRVSEFRRTTTLSQFFLLWPNEEDPPKGYAEYVIKLDANPDEITLEDVEQMRQRQAKRYSLPTYAFRIASMKEGCVVVKWFIRSVLVQEIVIKKTLVNDSFDGLLSICVGGFNFTYNNTIPWQNHDLHVSELESTSVTILSSDSSPQLVTLNTTTSSGPGVGAVRNTLGTQVTTGSGTAITATVTLVLVLVLVAAVLGFSQLC